jgi:hypothetical protein
MAKYWLAEQIRFSSNEVKNWPTWMKATENLNKLENNQGNSEENSRYGTDEVINHQKTSDDKKDLDTSD